MSPESEIDRWNRWSRYSRADLEKARRSTPQRRRKLLRLTWLCAAFIYLLPFGFVFVSPDGESLAARMIDAALPDPVATMFLIIVLGGAGAARKSKLSDEEARALADEAEEEERESREFAKWLWTGRGRGPGQK